MDGVSAVIKKDGRYLMIQQSRDKPFPLKWLCPSGKIKEGETSEGAVKRETKEEVGLEVKIVKKAATLKSDYGSEKTHFFVANWKSGEVKIERREISSFGWFSLGQILRLDLMPATRIFFEKHFRPF